MPSWRNNQHEVFSYTTRFFQLSLSPHSPFPTFCRCLSKANIHTLWCTRNDNAAIGSAERNTLTTGCLLLAAANGQSGDVWREWQKEREKKGKLIELSDVLPPLPTQRGGDGLVAASIAPKENEINGRIYVGSHAPQTSEDNGNSRKQREREAQSS